MATVTHKGKQYRFSDLAHYMEYEHREAIHQTSLATDDQGWWDDFVARYPDEADHLAEIVREVITNA